MSRLMTFGAAAVLLLSLGACSVTPGGYGRGSHYQGGHYYGGGTGYYQQQQPHYPRPYPYRNRW